jgi:NDP-sugar pyrophosphorylase family protein
MNAVVLAGGMGTRLAPFTTVFPKPLVPVGHHPILDIVVQQLAHYGFRDIILSVGYLGELIQAYFQNSNHRFADINISYVKEQKRMGTAGSLGLIKGLDQTFLVMSGDILTTLDYSKLVAYHRQKNAGLTIAMHKKRVKIDLGVCETDGDGLLTEYIEKPEKAYLVSMGIYVYEPSVLKYIKPNRYLDFPDLVMQLIKNGETVVGYPCDAYWLDIGRHEDYAQAQNEYQKMKTRLLPRHKK